MLQTTALMVFKGTIDASKRNVDGVQGHH